MCPTNESRVLVAVLDSEEVVLVEKSPGGAWSARAIATIGSVRARIFASLFDALIGRLRRCVEP